MTACRHPGNHRTVDGQRRFGGEHELPGIEGKTRNRDIGRDGVLRKEGVARGDIVLSQRLHHGGRIELEGGQQRLAGRGGQAVDDIARHQT